MAWEDLKAYRPLKKEDLKLAFKDLTNIIGMNLKEYGFERKDRKLYRLSYDLLEVIEIDYRGNWTGQNEYFKTNIGLIPLCWPGLVKDYYLVASKEIKEIDSSIKNHYRLTEEYNLLADYLTRKIVSNVLPYFNKYNSTEKVLKHYKDFKYKSVCGGNDINKSNFLILFSELKQHRIKNAIEIIDNELAYINLARTNLSDTKALIKLESEKSIWESLKSNTEGNRWNELDFQFAETEKEEIRKLKIKPVANMR